MDIVMVIQATSHNEIVKVTIKDVEYPYVIGV